MKPPRPLPLGGRSAAAPESPSPAHDPNAGARAATSSASISIRLADARARPPSLVSAVGVSIIHHPLTRRLERRANIGASRRAEATRRRPHRRRSGAPRHFGERALRRAPARRRRRDREGLQIARATPRPGPPAHPETAGCDDARRRSTNGRPRGAAAVELRRRIRGRAAPEESAGISPGPCAERRPPTTPPPPPGRGQSAVSHPYRNAGASGDFESGKMTPPESVAQSRAGTGDQRSGANNFRRFREAGSRGRQFYGAPAPLR